MRTVTRLRAAGRRAARTAIELDGHEWAEVDTEVVLRRALAAGATLTEEQCAALLHEDAFVRARRTAARLLSLRPRSSEELRRLLGDWRPWPRHRRPRNGAKSTVPPEAPHGGLRFDEATIAEVLAHFMAMGDLDDVRFARRFIRHHVKLKAIGRLKLRNHLLRLGVAEDVAEAALDAEFSDRGAAETDVIRRFIERRLSRFLREEPERRLRKLDAALQRAGFDRSVFRPLLEAALARDPATPFQP